MKGIRLLLLVLGGLAAQSAGAQQQLKIGFVDAAKILDEAPQAQLARSRLEEEFAPRDKSLVDAQRSLRDLEDRLVRDGSVMSEAERRRLERDIIGQRRELRRSQEEFRQDFNVRRNEELDKIQRRVYETIVNLAKEERFDLIVNAGAVIYASEQVDITNQVLNRLK